MITWISLVLKCILEIITSSVQEETWFDKMLRLINKLLIPANWQKMSLKDER